MSVETVFEIFKVNPPKKKVSQSVRDLTERPNHLLIVQVQYQLSLEQLQ